MPVINASIVVYNSEKEKVERLINSLIINRIDGKIYIIENSSERKLESLVHISPSIVYIYPGKNLGHGKAHNIALAKSLEDKVKYHLIINPDVYFDEGVLETLCKFMDDHPEVGIVIPKVLFPDGTIQPVCRLLPSPIDLILRRFFNWGPFKNIVKKRNFIYEMRFTKYNKIFEVPFISGCFMFLRVELLKKVGLFDERFFLYCDDLDLSRRFHKVSKTIFYPDSYIYHEWKRGSYKSKYLLLIHILDALKYFKKWGFFFDKERNSINKKILSKWLNK